MPRTIPPPNIVQPDSYKLNRSTATEELGVAGVKMFSGMVFEEYLPKLSGRQGARTYRKMRDNDSTVSAILFAVEMLLRGLTWTISCDKDGPEAEKSIEFADGVFFKDMGHTFDDFIAKVLSMLVFGWQYTEVVYKLRQGPENPDPKRRSIYNDGRFGIRKLADRSQETLDKWETDQDGNVLGLWQEPPTGMGSGSRFIPIEKALLFRPHMHKGSPEGRSILRGAYRSYYFLTNIEEIEAVAIERELNGLPVVYIPNAILNGTSVESKRAKSAYEQLVRDIKLNDQGGAVLPSNPYTDSDGNPTAYPQVKLELLSTNGTRSIDTNKIIIRYQQNIARAILADFIMLGTSGAGGGTGSFSLGETKLHMFGKALEGWLASIAETINRHLIPRLWTLNGFNHEFLPKLVPGKVLPENLQELGDFLKALTASGAPLFPDDDLENNLRERAGLPGIPPDRDSFEEPTTFEEDDPGNNPDDPNNLNPVPPKNKSKSGSKQTKAPKGTKGDQQVVEEEQE
jgi:hypothetical protein